MVANKVTLTVTLALVFFIQIDAETPKDDRSKLVQLFEAMVKAFIEGYADMAKPENVTNGDSTSGTENDTSSFAARVSKPVTIKPDNRSKLIQLFDAATNNVLSAIEDHMKDQKAYMNSIKNHTVKDTNNMFDWDVNGMKKKRQRYDVATYMNSAKVDRNEFASIGNSVYKQIYAEYKRKRGKTWW